MKKLITIICILFINTININASNDEVIEYDVSIKTISNGNKEIINNKDINTEDYIIISTKEKLLAFSINGFSMQDPEFFDDCIINKMNIIGQSTTYDCTYNSTKLKVVVEEYKKCISIKIPEKNSQITYKITKIIKE